MFSFSPARRDGAALAGGLVLDAAGGGLLLPLSLVYFTVLTDVPLAHLGALLAAAGLITVPVPVFAGALADRVGARTVVTAAQLLQAAAYVAFLWVRQPAGIFLASAAGAVGVRLFWSSVFALIADFADRRAGESRDLWYARANIARTAGIGAGGLVTGLVVTDGREGAYQAVAFAAAVCFCAAAGLIAVGTRLSGTSGGAAGAGDQGRVRGGYGVLVRDRVFLGLTAVNALYALCTVMLGLTLPTFVRSALHGPGWLSSVVLMGNAVLIAVLAGPIGRRVPHVRRTRVMCAAAGLWSAWGLALGAVARGSGLWAMAALASAMLLFTIAEVLHAPSSMALAAAVAVPGARGRYLAVFQYSFILAEIVAPVYFTRLFRIDHSLPFLSLVVIGVGAAAGTLWLERHLPAGALRSGG